MIILFCLDPSNPRQPDEAYRAEAAAAERLGLPVALVDHDALVHDNEPAKAVRRVSEQASPRLGLYRGWMMTPDQYQRFYDALDGKGVRLLNDPTAYRHCHYLPESYPAIESHTPRSVNPRNNLAHCFTCKKNLNNIDLLMTLDYDFRAAVTLLERWLKEYQAQQARKKNPTPPARS